MSEPQYNVADEDPTSIQIQTASKSDPRGSNVSHGWLVPLRLEQNVGVESCEIEARTANASLGGDGEYAADDETDLAVVGNRYLQPQLAASLQAALRRIQEDVHQGHKTQWTKATI